MSETSDEDEGPPSWLVAQKMSFGFYQISDEITGTLASRIPDDIIMLFKD